MRQLILTLVCLSWATTAVAQTPIRYLQWGMAGQAQVDGAVVPPGEVWLIQTWGIATTDNRVLDYMMQHVVPPGWYVPVMRSPMSGSTPVLAGERSLILQEGEYLKARVNSGSTFATMAVLYSGWSFPASALPALLMHGTVTVTTPPVDYSGFQAALSAASQALSDAAAAVP